jgi:hypothetical protein
MKAHLSALLARHAKRGNKNGGVFDGWKKEETGRAIKGKDRRVFYNEVYVQVVSSR